jgi:hypothetical protein
VDFENRVFAKFAAVHELPMIDAASAFPRDPRLFVDGIHMTAAGVKLHAWLTLQQLVPHLEAAIELGRLPRRAARPIQAAPVHERQLVRVADIRAACHEGGDGA